MENQDKHTESLEMIRSFFTDKIRFNQVLGLEIILLDPHQVKIRFPMKEQLIGNFLRGTLHGGVIASALDVAGGLISFLSLLQKFEGKSDAEKQKALGRLGTIDMRVDFLRPGYGREFVATAFILRAGNKVVVSRMELHNEEQTLIAVGTGTYFIS